MLLYKYRSLKNFEFVLDIILNERLYCAPYHQLNDPFEGLFRSVSNAQEIAFQYHGLGSRLSNPTTHHHTIEDCVERDAHKICSLSSSLNDVRLWAYYANGHKGIAFEIEVPENVAELFKVSYSPMLPNFGGTAISAPCSHDVLSCKTNHWDYEEEFRIIHSDNYFPLPNGIKALYVGTRTSDEHYALLEKIVGNRFPIYRTTINKNKVSVEPIRSS
jgi:hypothetical protein